MNSKIAISVIVFLAIIFFSPFFLKGKLPIPADALVGLYHPYRDFYSKDNPNGIAYKNFLITDPVRQLYPWKKIAIESVRQREVPLWNPYTMSGYPLLGNFQSGVFYPGNLLFFLFPQVLSWSFLIILQPILSGIFLYFYLKNLKVDILISLFGAIVFSYAGFSLSWMEWGNIIHTTLWLPLILLSIDQVFIYIANNKNFQFQMNARLVWVAVFIGALTTSFFAGHLQTFFYLLMISLLYIIARWWQYGRKRKTLLVFILCSLIFALITAVQWIPTLRFISLSARDIDVITYSTPGWFIPWQHIVQFIVPDFFGNPATQNYWGVWNYGEFLGYVGLPALLFGLYAVIFRRDKKVLFFGSLLLVAFIFAFPTGISSLPYLLHIPLISTAQPTRLLFIIDFSLCILAVLGLEYFIKKHDKNIIIVIVFFATIFLMLWGIVLLTSIIPPDQGIVVKRNMLIPSAMFILTAATVIGMIFFKKYKTLGVCLLILITFFDLYRVGNKYNAFSDQKFLFPTTKTLSFLQMQEIPFRVMTTDSRIFAPNILSTYAIESVDGYDPLYLRRYGELIAASERKEPNIVPPFGFNRIITPHNYDSPIIDLLGVKYVLSLTAISSPKLQKVFQEGQTQVYENKDAFPRAFLVKELIQAKSKQDAIEKVFSQNLHDVAVVEGSLPDISPSSQSRIEKIAYTANAISFEIHSEGTEFVVLTSTYYPTWKAIVTDKTSGMKKRYTLYQTDFNFIGIPIMKGDYLVEFSHEMF